MAVNVLWDSCEYVHLILEPCLDKKGNLMNKEALNKAFYLNNVIMY